MARPKERDREDVKSKILEKSKQLFLDIGYRNITIRKIAREIGYTPGTIYLYFKNKDEILYELHNEGFRVLYRYKLAMQKRGYANALDRLHQGGRMYIDFALENPEYYELMFNMPEPRDYLEAQRNRRDKAGVQVEDYAMRSYEFLLESVQGVMDDGYMQGIDPNLAAFFFWSTVHGMVSLIIRKRVPYPQTPSKHLAYDAIDVLMNWTKYLKF